jgi:hypothetical protein
MLTLVEKQKEYANGLVDNPPSSERTADGEIFWRGYRNSHKKIKDCAVMAGVPGSLHRLIFKAGQRLGRRQPTGCKP